jgi:hypothetical protein
VSQTVKYRRGVELTVSTAKCSLPPQAGIAAKRNDVSISLRGENMFGINDLFQWERFVTPTVIKVFYWLAVIISVLLGMAGAVSALREMAFNPFNGLIYLISSLLGGFMGVIVARIIAETVLIVFRINEHLGAIRNQAAALRNPEANHRGQ